MVGNVYRRLEFDFPMLHPHQVAGMELLAHHPHHILADDVGLGKTFTGLATPALLDARGELAPCEPGAPCRILYLTEGGLTKQTAEEIRRAVPRAVVLSQDDLVVRSESGKQMARLAALRQAGIDFLVLSYEQASGKLGERLGLHAYRYPLVIVDEAANLKGGGPLALAVRALAELGERVIGMTATVIENSADELWHIANALAMPHLWSWEEFEGMVTWEQRSHGPYQAPQSVCTGWKPHAIEPVRQFVQANILRRTVDDVRLRLPRKVGREVLEVPSTAAQVAEYDAVEARGGSVHQLAGSILNFTQGSPLVDAFVRSLREHDEQVLTHARRRKMVARIEHQLHSAGISFATIQGSTTSAERQRAVDGFRAGDVRVLLGTEIVGRGLNLQHARRIVSIGETSWNPAQIAQLEGRVRRDGSPHETYEHTMIIPNLPLFASQFAVRNRKSAMAEAVLLE